MGMSPSTPTNSAMGYSQNSLSAAAGATGGMPQLQATNGIGGQGSQPGNAAAMETINQAYAGIQQYAGLSGLLNQGKWHFLSHFQWRPLV